MLTVIMVHRSQNVCAFGHFSKVTKKKHENNNMGDGKLLPTSKTNFTA